MFKQGQLPQGLFLGLRFKPPKTPQLQVFFTLKRALDAKTYRITLYKYNFQAVARRCSIKKVFREISQNSQENTCARVSLLIKLQGSDLQLYQKRNSGTRPATLLKKRLWHWCFPVNFAKFLRTPFLTKYLWWLLLII